MDKGNPAINEFVVKASEYFKDENNTPTVVGAGVFAVVGLLSGAVIVPAIIGGATTYFMKKGKK